MMDNLELKKRIIIAGRVAVEQLIKVAEEDIIVDSESSIEEIVNRLIENPSGANAKSAIEEIGNLMQKDLSADKMKNAASAKKVAIFDAFDIIKRIEEEEQEFGDAQEKISSINSKSGFAERRAKNS